MIYVGIDVASEKHDVCIMSEMGDIYKNVFQIKNSKSEYKKLLSYINDAKKLFKDSKVRIGIESTGVYSTTILNSFVDDQDCSVIFINPILTNMFQLSTKVHYAKTDKIDAKGICTFLSKNQDFYTYTPPLYSISQIKSLYRELIKYNKLINMTTNELTGKIHTVFPEFFSFFPKLKGVLPFELLKMYPTPTDYKGKHKDTLTEFCRKTSYGHFIEEDVDALIKAANESVGVYSSSDAIIIRQLVNIILLYRQSKNEIIKELVSLTKKHCPKLLTIPGIGAICAAGIIGEIGRIENFRNADSLLAYAGLNPIVYESGNYKAEHTKISKRGSSYLRNAIIISSRIIVKHDPTFITYFNKKIDEGKSYNCAIGHVSKKLVRVIFHILKNDCEYQPINN